MSEVLFFPRENSYLRANVLLYGEPIQQKQKAGIVMSLNDTTLTKVAYGKYATRIPDEVGYRIYEWFSLQ